MKRIEALIIVLALMVLGGCSEEDSKESQESVVKIKVGVLLYKQDDTFISSIIENFEIVAKERELEENMKISITCTDGKGNQSVQNDQVDKFIEQGYDVLCINLVDRTAAATVIDKAKNADIPIIFFNREPVKEDLMRWNKVYYVGSVSSESGMIQGQIILDIYDKDSALVDRNQDNKIQYVMLEGEQGHQDALIRTEYSVKTLTAQGLKVEKLANDTANWQRGQASARMEQWITKFGDGVEVVIGNNDDMALGALDAYQKLGKENIPLIVGVDGTLPALKAIQEGYMTGTVLNDARGQAESIMNLCYSLALNCPLEDTVTLIDEKYVRLPCQKITAENIQGYLP